MKLEKVVLYCQIIRTHNCEKWCCFCRRCFL